MSTCSSCVYAKTIKAQPTDLGGQLVCRRLPPNVSVVLIPKEGLDGRVALTPQSFTTVPSVGKGDWCGEYEGNALA